MPQWIGKEKRR